MLSRCRQRRGSNGTTYTASNIEVILEFTFLLLRRIEIPLQTYISCTSYRALAKLANHLKPMNVETVAVALSVLVVPLTTLLFELYMPHFMKKREGSISRIPAPAYVDTLLEKCTISTLNMYVIYCQLKF